VREEIAVFINGDDGGVGGDKGASGDARDKLHRRVETQDERLHGVALDGERDARGGIIGPGDGVLSGKNARQIVVRCGMARKIFAAAQEEGPVHGFPDVLGGIPGHIEIVPDAVQFYDVPAVRVAAAVADEDAVGNVGHPQKLHEQQGIALADHAACFEPVIGRVDRERIVIRIVGADVFVDFPHLGVVGQTVELE